ncbi:hypothetical protein [Wenzhouxiangella sediminis]|nr:hypothetical protein [Wenzhouxiangella sediminis]
MSLQQVAKQVERQVFSVQEIPEEAEPVKFAQSLFVFVILALGALNFLIEGVFSWIFPVSIPLAGYYAIAVFRTGYAIGRYEVYHRDKNPNMYKVHLLGAVGLMILAFLAWVT